MAQRGMTLLEARLKQRREFPAPKRRINTKSCIPCPQVGYTFVIANKCGASTTTMYIRDRHAQPAISMVECQELFPDLPLVVMWRDPFKRAESIYRWARGHGKPVHEHGIFPNWELPFPLWVCQLCAPPYDEHGVPGEWFDLHACSQSFLESPLWKEPEIRIPWDWPRLEKMFDCALTARNASDKSILVEWTTETKQMLREHWAKDFAIWEKINAA